MRSLSSNTMSRQTSKSQLTAAKLTNGVTTMETSILEPSASSDQETMDNYEAEAKSDVVSEPDDDHRVRDSLREMNVQDGNLSKPSEVEKFIISPTPSEDSFARVENDESAPDCSRSSAPVDVDDSQDLESNQVTVILGTSSPSCEGEKGLIEDKSFTTCFEVREKNQIMEKPPSAHKEQEERSALYEVTENAPSILLSLPLDSLHCIASFLTPGEWSNFGQCGTAANRVSREIFRRVRIHGFRCASEVITAWVSKQQHLTTTYYRNGNVTHEKGRILFILQKLGQHADAKELCALYIEAGVPIYPHSLGHSYHTLVWRMGVEAREIERLASEIESARNSSDRLTESNERDDGSYGRQKIDRFYTERYEARAHEGYCDSLTYLEEKSLYWLNVESACLGPAGLRPNFRRNLSASRFLPRPQTVVNAGGEGRVQFPAIREPLLRLNATALTHTQSSQGAPFALFCSNSCSDVRKRSPKILMKIHRHLLDQHLFGKSNVNDSDGLMSTPPVSLSADFFHPHYNNQSQSTRLNQSKPAMASHLVSNNGFTEATLTRPPKLRTKEPSSIFHHGGRF